MPSVYIKTLGCQMNVYDTRMVQGLLRARGYVLCDDPEAADVILVNSCYVREKVKHKVYSLLGRYRLLRRRHPGVILGMWGCLVQRAGEDVLQRAGDLDLIVGTHNLHRIPDLLAQVTASGEQVYEVWPEGVIPEGLPVYREHPVSAFVPVIRGCNNFCTYCNVPYCRGRQVSRTPDRVLAEIRALSECGCAEVTLLGQNVNTYGKDHPGFPDFASLLRQVHEIARIRRIRFLTSHPRDLTDRLIATMAGLPKICPHLHLALQSGSNSVLGRMGRGYTRERYLELVAALRRAVPEVSLTTDLIVGFPGERETNFEDTLDMVERVRFDGAFAFVFSPLPGTRAAGFTGQIPRAVAGERLRRLIGLQQRITREQNQTLVGRTEEVLVEGVAPKGTQDLQGRTAGNKIVVFPGTRDLIGRMVTARIDAGGCWALQGSLP